MVGWSQPTIGVNSRDWGVATPIFWDRGVSMKYYYILKCTGIRDENTFQSGDFPEIERFVHIE